MELHRLLYHTKIEYESTLKYYPVRGPRIARYPGCNWEGVHRCCGGASDDYDEQRKVLGTSHTSSHHDVYASYD